MNEPRSTQYPLRRLTKSHAQRFLIIDEQDITDTDMLNYDWYPARTKRVNIETGELVDTFKVIASRPGEKKVSLARLLMGFPPGQVKHVNGNGLDCRRSNLRVFERPKPAQVLVNS